MEQFCSYILCFIVTEHIELVKDVTKKIINIFTLCKYMYYKINIPQRSLRNNNTI